jgi:hypothetical protein
VRRSIRSWSLAERTDASRRHWELKDKMARRNERDECCEEVPYLFRVQIREREAGDAVGVDALQDGTGSTSVKRNWEAGREFS